MSLSFDPRIRIRVESYSNGTTKYIIETRKRFLWFRWWSASYGFDHGYCACCRATTLAEAYSLVADIEQDFARKAARQTGVSYVNKFEPLDP